MLSKETYNQLREIHGERLIGAMSCLVEDINVAVTRDEGFLEVDAIFRVDGEARYGCYINLEDMFCSCMDNFVRKRKCKHLIAIVIQAFSMGKLSEGELLELLRGG